MQNETFDLQPDMRDTGQAVGTSLLAASGLTAALAAASCCALPVALGAIGLSSAWIGGVASVAIRWQPWLLWGSLISLAVSAVIMLRKSITCNRASYCTLRGFRWVVFAMIVIGFGLAGLAFWGD